MEASWEKLAVPLCCWTALSFLGCRSEEAVGVPPYQVSDSSGIEIIWSGPVTNDGEQAWQVDTSPVLQIGEVDGEAPFIFQRISAATRAPDGRIIVSDARAMDIRVFRADGSHETSFGGRGEGPMEFAARPFISMAPPDTLVVWDSGSFRLSWFDFEGTLLRQQSLAPMVVGLSLDLGMRSWSLGGDGFLLWSGPPLGGAGDGVRNVTLVDPEREASHDFGSHETFRYVPTSNRGISLMDWFEPSVEAALGPDPTRVAISSPEIWEVRSFDAGGRLLRILRAPIPRVQVTAEVRATRRADLENLATQFRLPAGEGAEIDDRLPVPDSLPAISKLLWDRTGNLWVGRREADPRETQDYDVFDSDGHWLTKVHFSRDLGYPLEIGEDYLMATWFDDLGVPYLRIYRLEKPGV